MSFPLYGHRFEHVMLRRAHKSCHYRSINQSLNLAETFIIAQPCVAPGTPQLTSPANNSIVTANPPTLTWSESGYSVDLSQWYPPTSSLGLNIAARVAMRARGRLELETTGGCTARLLLPRGPR